MRIEDIIYMPIVINKTHESCFRSYQILGLVKEMLGRNDSIETILEVIELIESLSIINEGKSIDKE